MLELYTTVACHLRNQRDSEAASKLWDDLWAAYEKGRAEGVGEFVVQLVELPNTDEELS